MESNLLVEGEDEEGVYWGALDGLDEGPYCRRVAAEEQLRIQRLDANLEASGLALGLAPDRPPWTWFVSPTQMSYWLTIRIGWKTDFFSRTAIVFLCLCCYCCLLARHAMLLRRGSFKRI